MWRLVNLLWFGQGLASAEAVLIGRSAGLQPARLREVLMTGPASSAFISSYLPSPSRGDYLTSFGLDRCVEELDSIERHAHREGLPAAVTSLVARLHREALDRFGPVDGELMGVAYLEDQAGQRLRDLEH